MTARIGARVMLSQFPDITYATAAQPHAVRVLRTTGSLSTAPQGHADACAKIATETETTPDTECAHAPQPMRF